MVATTAISGLCAGGIVFCVWFLVALYKEHKCRPTPFFVRLDTDLSKHKFSLLRELERWFREAA